ncbi:MAG: hypothetical protein QOF98_1145, partial [Streptomyces sp.]|nr:hypothetical protein [Streptomyces sp.]
MEAGEADRDGAAADLDPGAGGEFDGTAAVAPQDAVRGLG